MNGFTIDEDKLLKQLRQAKDLEIEHLLTQYGTSLKDVREMFPQLSGAVRQRQLTTALPTQPIFFTAAEAAEMGLGIGEDWMLKFTPMEGNGGYTSSFITPEKWEVTEDDRYISPTGERYTRADLQALLSMPVEGLTEAPLTAEPLSIENLTEEGQRLYEEYQFGGGKLDVREWMQLMEEERIGTEQVFGKVFPEQDISEVISYIETNTEQFLADLREIGWTEDTEALLRTIIPEITETDLQDIFGTTVVPEFVPESWAKDYLWDPFIAGAAGFKQGIETFLFTNPPSPPSEAVPFPVATRTTPIAPEWQFETAQAQYENALELTTQGYLRRRADQEAFWADHPELTPNPEYLESPWANPSLFKDPGYIAYTISNSLAYALSVMGTIVAVSAVATPFVGIPAGLVVAGMPEAGSMLDELVDLGVPIEQAIGPSRLYGLAVGGIETVSDLPFIGLIFKPIGVPIKAMFKTIFRGVANRLAKKILTGVLITQIEGVEETVTQVVHNTILKHYDETQSILEGVSHAYIQGVIASLPFGGIGGHASFNTFYDRLSPDMQKRFDGLVVDGIKGGLSKQESQIYATNELAKVPENEAELSQAIEAAQEEYWAEHGPAPAPVIPETAENVLREIEVMGEVAKRGVPIIPEIATGQEYTATVYRGYKVEGAPVDEGLFGKGTYYTTNREYAETYDGKEVISVTLKNPFVINNQQEADAFWNETTRPARQKAINEGKTVVEADELAAQAAREWLESRGYDGLIARGIIAPGDEVVVFEPEKAVRVPKAKDVLTREEAKKVGDPEKLYIIDEIYDKGLAVNADGTMTLYHATTKERAVEIIKTGIFKTTEGAPDAYGVYFSTSPEVSESYGDGTLVIARVKVRDLNLDDSFPGRPRMDFQVNTERGIYKATTVEVAPAIPTTEPGMPEAGLQPSMLAEVPAKEVRPEARGKLVQARLGDYLQLREYNAKAVTDRISEIKKALETPGRLPKELGLKGNLRLELARLEAQQELDAIESVEELDHLIKQVGEELGLRSMPYAGYGGKSHIDLIRSPTHRLFKEYTSKQLDEIMKVYQQARQTLSPEVPAVSSVKAEDIPTDIPALTNVSLTPKQVQKTLDLFKEAVAAPNTEGQRAAALELRKHAFAQRAKAASESAETMIAEGMNPEEAIKLAEQQFMTGKLPDLTTDYFSDLTQEMQNVLFAKVYNYWKDKSWTELISTFDALTNALAGKSIPRVKGIGTKYFPEGGSAWDRLARVFIGDMEILQTLDQGKSLRDIIEGVFLETGRGSVPLNQETVNWLKELSTISAEDRLLLTKPLSEITEADVHRIAQSWFYQRRQELQTLLEDGVITQEEYKLQLAIAKDRVFPYRPIAPAPYYPGVAFGQPRLAEKYTTLEIEEDRTARELWLKREAMEAEKGLAEAKLEEYQPIPKFEPPISDAFEQLPLLTFREQQTIVRILKEAGIGAVDIGNFLRANKASCDMSGWRQTALLSVANPVEAYRSEVEAWKALFSEKSSEANSEWVKRQPSYPYYVDMVERTGNDFLRMLVAPKGTAQWQAAEEFGHLTEERLIPRFTAKIPWIKWAGRAYVVKINTMSIMVYNKCLELTLRLNEEYAIGKRKLKEGEAFSIRQEMDDYGKALAWMTQRASLGRARTLAPEAGAIFFAARSKLGRFLTPKLLIDSNPRVRAFAWKNIGSFVGLMSGLVMLGYALGLWDVERDPRSAEYMSIRIGNMRIDPWAGHRQFLVLYSRLISGTGISSVTGKEYEVNPIAALTTFFRTSLAPLTSILLNFWTGKNFLGEEVDIANPRQWLEQLAPFSVQDFWEAYEDDWLNGVIAILPGFFGMGVQTYTGDWNENWTKLGLPKYLENTGYGIYEPVYDLADFWADTASQFRGVDPATLTESKGYPESVRSIAEALQIIETIETLPNKRLASLNADPEEGTTFIQYYQMWKERQMIVASGDEEKLKDFDADERTRNAYLGNMTQAQYALLMQYHSLPESQKAEFLGNHPEIYINPREDWLRSHPEENALLALWDKSKAYSLAALDKVTALARSLGIPENAMIARDLDAVAQLKMKHKNLFDLLDVYSGLDDEIKDAEGLTARDRAVQELYTNNPDLRDDMRRIEALSEGTKEMPTLDDIVEAWVDRGRIADEFGSSSAEAKLWLLDNREAHQWALDSALLTDDGTDWNEPVLRLLVQYRDDFDKYGDYGDISSDSYIPDDEQRAEARDRLLFDAQDNLTAFGKAYYTREASSQGYSEGNWNAFVEYAGLPIWGSWRERFLLDNADFYKEYTDPEVGNHPLIDKTRVRPVNRDKIYQQFYDEFQSWDETGGMAPKAIENMRAELDAIERGGLTFQEARYSVQAYDVGFPENLIDDYVEWNSTDRKDYEDDWWLMEHKEFYKAMYDLDIWTEYRDFSKVPTREVYNLYKTYLGLPTGTPRYDFRAKHLDLDDWLVLKFGYKPIQDRGSTGAEPTPWEELQAAEAFKRTFK